MGRNGSNAKILLGKLLICFGTQAHRGGGGLRWVAGLYVWGSDVYCIVLV